ncbi:MAG: orotidine-5'-phosphate decarboxylase [Thermosynechococcaceae cyanobacterium MS004]|nr:orotidine-5'-phosphate decarboxylase [Thermosynechococcaceae cyanobacterium MS004]
MNNASRLSRKSIETQDRLIVALDFDTIAAAKELVETLGESVTFYKVGLQLFMTDGYYDLVDWLSDRHKKVFVDLKFFDVPQTVGSAVRQLKDRKATFATVHGNDEILKAAVKEKGTLKILAVTVLTSLDRNDLKDLGFDCDVSQLVLSRAKRAFAIGCDGVISSGMEAQALRDNLEDNFLIVTPGIRPVDNVDDQKRTVDVEEAFLSGADYIVVGRPIKDAENPAQAAQNIQDRIRQLFEA